MTSTVNHKPDTMYIMNHKMHNESELMLHCDDIEMVLPQKKEKNYDNELKDTLSNSSMNINQ